MRALVSGGRTGGHLIPGISMYREFKSRNIDCRYIMSVFDLNYPLTGIVEPADRYLLSLKNMSRKLSFKTPVYIIKIFFTFLKVFFRIRKFNPHFILITGGYISNPVALSAVILHKPLYIIEQNSVAGITNRFYAPFARKIFTSFPDTKKIPVKKSVFTGNPSLFHDKISRNAARSFFNLADSGRVVGVTSGSQGAKKINDCIIGMLPELSKKNIGVIWSVGSVEYKKLQTDNKVEILKSSYPNLRIYQFIEKMDFFFSAIDCVISRAGASSISEFIHYGKPSLLVPIKNSPDDHQALNASYITSNKGGITINEDSLSPALLSENLFQIFENLPYYIGNIGKISSGRPEISERVIADNIFADYFGFKLF